MAGANITNNPRFVSYDDDELEELLKPKPSKNTNNSTKTALTLFKKFCAETNSSITNVDTITHQELDRLLIKFYAGARKENGDLYKVNTMRSLRFSLQRYFLQSRNINILEDSEFNKSNCCFKNVLKETRRAGKGDTNHYPEIEPEDLKKLYQSFDSNSPTGLQEKVWFDIMFQLIRRGRENLRGMSKDTFAIGKDATGKRFIYQTKSEIDKNHDISDDTFDTTGEGRIYETGGFNCPVRTFLKYVSLLHPLQPALWQRPRDIVNACDLIWYCCAPLGEKSLGNMMPKLSAKYGLSERYTNHSIRVTSLQVLEDENIEGRHIIRISGHKSVDSVDNYARRLSASRKRNISSLFSNHLSDANSAHQNQDRAPSCSKKSSIASSTMATTTNNNDEEENNLVDFNVDSGVDDETLSAIPSRLLMEPKGFFKPVFYNCDNCTISFNINMK